MALDVAVSRTLTVHGEYAFPGNLSWSMDTIDRHSAIQIKYVLACASDQPDVVLVFSTWKEVEVGQGFIQATLTPASSDSEDAITYLYGGTMSSDLAEVLDSYDILQCFHADDFFGIARKLWPESEQAMFKWRRKTRDLFEPIKMSKATWRPNLNDVIEQTPTLWESTVLTESQWGQLEQRVACRPDEPALTTTTMDESVDEGEEKAEEEEEAETKEEKMPTVPEVLALPDVNNVFYKSLAFATLRLHQVVALFRHAILKGAAVRVRRGGRGKNSNEVVAVPVAVDSFMFPPKRNPQFDSIFANLGLI